MNIEVTQKADGWMLGTIEGGYQGLRQANGSVLPRPALCEYREVL